MVHIVENRKKTNSKPKLNHTNTGKKGDKIRRGKTENMGKKKMT